MLLGPPTSMCITPISCKVWVWSGRLEDFESNTMSHNNDKDRAARAAKYLAFNLSIHFQINVLPLIQRSG